MANITSMQKQASNGLERQGLGLVFGCGLSRTGNKSLGDALKTLGYNPIKYPKSIDDLGSTYNAAVDITVIAWLDELDARFPDAKWILTIRDMESWLKSCDRWFGRSLDVYPQYKQDYLRHYRRVVYGSEKFDRNLWCSVYHQHIDRVKNKFSQRQNQLLIMNICEGENWDNLCDFLGMPVPKLSFPSIS